MGYFNWEISGVRFLVLTPKVKLPQLGHFLFEEKVFKYFAQNITCQLLPTSRDSTFGYFIGSRGFFLRNRLTFQENLFLFFRDSLFNVSQQWQNEELIRVMPREPRKLVLCLSFFFGKQKQFWQLIFSIEQKIEEYNSPQAPRPKKSSIIVENLCVMFEVVVL